jgi:hypothetical protein
MLGWEYTFYNIPCNNIKHQLPNSVKDIRYVYKGKKSLRMEHVSLCGVVTN